MIKWILILIVHHQRIKPRLFIKPEGVPIRTLPYGRFEHLEDQFWYWAVDVLCSSWFFFPASASRGFVVYPTDHPSIRTLFHQIGDLGYSVEVYLFPHNDLRALPPGDRHWAVVIGDAILVIVPPSLSSDSPGDSSDDGSSGSVSGSSCIKPYHDLDNVDPNFPWLGVGEGF